MKPSFVNYFENHLDTYLTLLKRMVDINSFTANPHGVNKLGLMTARVFAPLGFTAEYLQSVSPLYGKHLFLTRPARTPRNRSAPTIALVSHLDTVFPPDEEQRNDFVWRPAGERVYGPGTVDIKGGTLLVYMLLDGLRALRPDVYDSVNWLVALDATEETGGFDFGDLVRARLADNGLACLVFEGGAYVDGQFTLVAARKGIAVYRIIVNGRSAHAGSAHAQGANAVVQMADVISQVAALTDYGRGITFNVGTVVGGTVINRVPHYAAASVEMRAFDPKVYAAGIDAMLALNGFSSVGAANGDYACQVSVAVEHKVAPWPRNAGTERLMEVWQETAVELGQSIIPEERGGLSDGNFLWADVPTLDGLGPAGGNAHCSEHTPDGSKDQEYVLATSIVPKARINTLAVLRLVEAYYH